MKFRIRDKEFESEEIAQIYPAAMIKSGEGEEVTPISIEWVEQYKDHPEVVVKHYALIVHLKDKSTYNFEFSTKGELFGFMEELANTIEESKSL